MPLEGITTAQASDREPHTLSNLGIAEVCLNPRLSQVNKDLALAPCIADKLRHVKTFVAAFFFPDSLPNRSSTVSALPLTDSRGFHSPTGLRELSVLSARSTG